MWCYAHHHLQTGSSKNRSARRTTAAQTDRAPATAPAPPGRRATTLYELQQPLQTCAPGARSRVRALREPLHCAHACEPAPCRRGRARTTEWPTHFNSRPFASYNSHQVDAGAARLEVERVHLARSPDAVGERGREADNDDGSQQLGRQLARRVKVELAVGVVLQGSVIRA